MISAAETLLSFVPTNSHLVFETLIALTAATCVEDSPSPKTQPAEIPHSPSFTLTTVSTTLVFVTDKDKAVLPAF